MRRNVDGLRNGACRMATWFAAAATLLVPLSPSPCLAQTCTPLWRDVSGPFGGNSSLRGAYDAEHHQWVTLRFEYGSPTPHMDTHVFDGRLWRQAQVPGPPRSYKAPTATGASPCATTP